MRRSYWSEYAEGAFGGAEDFDRNNVLKMASNRSKPLGREARIWTDDGDRQRLVSHLWPGGHESSC
jgi:hypothetical protein